MQDFIEAYVNNAGTVEFGKNFIYDANKHYFNELDTKIINIFIDHYYSDIQATPKSLNSTIMAKNYY